MHIQGSDACLRIKYEQTIGDIKRAVEAKLGIPAAAQQLFWHNKELTSVSVDQLKCPSCTCLAATQVPRP